MNQAETNRVAWRTLFQRLKTSSDAQIELLRLERETLRARVAELEAGQDEAKGFIEGLDVENNALRARVAELESMNKMLCGKLDDQRRALWDPCQPYLKDGETPAERIERERKDLTATVGMLANERRRAEDLFQQCRLGFEYREELRARVAELEAIEKAARELVNEGMRNNGYALCVVEKPDNSDPHYRLCTLLERATPSAGAVPE